MARYYGWYSNRCRGDRAKHTPDVSQDQGTETQSVPEDAVLIDVRSYRPRRIPSPRWRECIKKIWEVDPLSCPRCGAEMKILAFITDGAVIEHILRHLGLWREEASLCFASTSRSPPEEILDTEDPMPVVEDVQAAPTDDLFFMDEAPPDEAYFMDPVYPD